MHGLRRLLDCFGRWDARVTPIPFEEIRESLGRLELAPGGLDGLAEFGDRSYFRLSVRRRPHYEALVIGWRSGQVSPVHDHRDSSCVVLVVRGCATETCFVASPCGQLVPSKSRGFPTGSVVGCRGDDIHQMANLEAAGIDLVTLHVYSPPPSRWNSYPLDATTLANNDALIRDRPETRAIDPWPMHPTALGA